MFFATKWVKGHEFINLKNGTKTLFFNSLCRNPNLGLTTKTRGCKVAGQVGDPGVISHALGSAKSVKESTFTLPSELPWWELEFQMDS
jgi:hypothetical protein